MGLIRVNGSLQGSAAVKTLFTKAITSFSVTPLIFTCTLHECLCVLKCVYVFVCTLTVDLQYFSGLLWCLCECHMVHFAGVGHSIIISVHVQLQRAPYCKCLPTCIHLFGTFGESCTLSEAGHLSYKVWRPHTKVKPLCLTVWLSPALQTQLDSHIFIMVLGHFGGIMHTFIMARTLHWKRL